MQILVVYIKVINAFEKQACQNGHYSVLFFRMIRQMSVFSVANVNHAYPRIPSRADNCKNMTNQWNNIEYFKIQTANALLSLLFYFFVCFIIKKFSQEAIVLRICD